MLRQGDTVILDNLSSHKNEEAARLIAGAGARLLKPSAYFLRQPRRHLLMQTLMDKGVPADKAMESAYLPEDFGLVDATVALYLDRIREQCEELGQTNDHLELINITQHMKANCAVVGTTAQKSGIGASQACAFPYGRKQASGC